MITPSALINRIISFSQPHRYGRDHLTTTDHRPSTINHQPSTINHQPSTINHQPSTINHQPSTINRQPSTTSTSSITICITSQISDSCHVL
jgi:hypothetical protein